MGSDYNVVCTTELVENSMWTIVRLEANNTGIEEVEKRDEGVEEIFDLQGRKVEKPKNGIYIVNGKKMIIK